MGNRYLTLLSNWQGWNSTLFFCRSFWRILWVLLVQRKGVEYPDLRFAQIDDIALVVGGIDQIEVFEEAQGIGVGEEVRHFLKVM